ncbi:MAG: DUF885 domain-containing protein [Gemmatimonadetes bacterium]|nr:DUF885 domain-containing protein [Gemmatimonadota bacterium]
MRFRFPGRVVVLGAAAIVLANAVSAAVAEAQGAARPSYQALTTLFREWRTFERHALRDGVPDYTAGTLRQKHAALAGWRSRLRAIDTTGWTTEEQVDWHIVRAEFNGLDFNIRVLKPWERDPAFYVTVWPDQSDTPDHEGPTNHAVIELWKYTYPLSAESQARLRGELETVRPMLAQARVNLTGNARDLWVAGTGSVRGQVRDLDELARTPSATPNLLAAIRDARQATMEFVTWLDAQAPSKNGPSGIGAADYTWSLRNVHLIPLTYEDEVAILKRELARAHASLRLEEQANRGRPQIEPVKTEAEFRARANASVDHLMRFLRERDVITVKPNMDPALRPKIGRFVPIEQRNFFSIATHLEPNTLYTHFYHWWDLAQMRDEPHASPIRREALLYNIWDSRSEGMATAFEEAMMHAGLYESNPRAREIVWIMLAQRAARGLGSLYAQSNEYTMKQAADFQVAWTPRGWMSPTLELLGFEQQLYLRQPGYGTSYIIGKHLLDDLLREMSELRGAQFSLREYYDAVNRAGMIPVSLIRWQLTGKADQIRALAR